LFVTVHRFAPETAVSTSVIFGFWVSSVFFQVQEVAAPSAKKKGKGWGNSGKGKGKGGKGGKPKK